MISIQKNQNIPNEPNLKVFSETGQYSETDLIQCYDISDPSLAVSALQAQYVKYGPIVYQFNEPEELGEAISKIDPESTHDSVLLYKEEEDRKLRRNKGDLQSNTSVTDKNSEEEIVDNKKTDIKEEIKNEEELDEQTTSEDVSTTPNIPIQDNISTTTPVTIQNDTSTTTPATIIDNKDIIDGEQNSTTTEKIIESTNSVIEALTETKEAISETTEVISDTIETISSNVENAQ